MSANATGPDDVEIRWLHASDADSLAACFRRCYGDSYVDDLFHDPARIAAAVRSGRIRSAVAVHPRHGVVGHMAITSCEPGALSAELGNTVVDPEQRGKNLAVRLTALLTRRCVEDGLVGFVHYPTTAHPAMQKLAARGRGTELGVLLDYIPAETRYLGMRGQAERESGERLAVVAFHHGLGEAPARTVHPPEQHREQARLLYEHAGLDRRLGDGPSELPERPTRLDAGFTPRRGLLRLEARDPGSDLGARLAEAVRRRPMAPAILDLSLADPATPSAARVASAGGFFFGAILPEYRADGDALRLQRLPGPPREPLLVTERGRVLFRHALADREAAL